MEVIDTDWGKIVIIPNTEYNLEFRYELRNVRRINHDDPDEQPLIAELEKREKILEKAFMKRTEEMERAFATLHNGDDVERWEEEHLINFNVYFHDRLDLLCEKINGCSFEYAERSTHGWCL